jgi:hypothetical protein
MAELIGPIRFKGSIGGMSCYYNKVLKKWIFRTKGGANKNQIENNAAFARTRENMTEFNACGKFCKQIRLGLFELDELNYGMYMNGMVKLAKFIQKMDPIGPRGWRSIEASRHKEMLTDIDFNQNHPFKQVVLRKPVVTSDADRMTVTVEFPHFVSQWELFWKEKYSDYRFILAISQLSDYTGDAPSKTFGAQYPDLEENQGLCVGEWMSRSTEAHDISLTASFLEGNIPPTDATVLVALGIEIAMGRTGRAIYSQKGDGTMALVACL